MDFLPEEIEQYAEKFTQKESAILAELSRETQHKILNPRMLSGHLQGRVLSLLSKIHRPKTILEIGTYTGYSCICLSEGLDSKGKIITIDINDELESFTRSFFQKAGIKDRVNFIIGNAVDEIPKIKESIDLVFIDADKENYTTYFDLVIDRLSPGGLIIADNVLWSGKVLDKEKNNDKDTLGLIEYVEQVSRDNRVENVLMPVRDGLMISRKV